MTEAPKTQPCKCITCGKTYLLPVPTTWIYLNCPECKARKDKK